MDIQSFGLVIEIILLAVVVAAAAWPRIRDFSRRKEEQELDDALDDLAERQDRGEHIPDSDLDRLVDLLSDEKYSRMGRMRRRMVERIVRDARPKAPSSAPPVRGQGPSGGPAHRSPGARSDAKVLTGPWEGSGAGD